MEFGVPFITIPTKRTIDGLRSFAYNVMQGEIPKPIFNLPALTLIGLLCLTFSTLGSAIRNLNQKAYEAGKAPNFFSQRSYFGRFDFSFSTNIPWLTIIHFQKNQTTTMTLPISGPFLINSTKHSPSTTQTPLPVFNGVFVCRYRKVNRKYLRRQHRNWMLSLKALPGRIGC